MNMDMKAAKVRSKQGRSVMVAFRLQAQAVVKIIPSANSMVPTVQKLTRPVVEGVLDCFICVLKSHI